MKTIMKQLEMRAFMLLAFVLLTATTVKAATNEESLIIKVANNYVTADNCNNITGSGISGTITFNYETHTLTLNNATINAHNCDGIEFGWSLIDNQSADIPMKLVLVGKNFINVTRDNMVVYKAVKCLNTLTIQGTGSLSCGNYGIETGGCNLNIKGGCQLVVSSLSNATNLGTGKVITISGANTQISTTTSSISGFDEFVLKDGLKVIEPEGAYYDTAKRTLRTSNVSFISGGVYIASKPLVKDYDLWVGGTRVTSANKDNIPVDAGTAKYNPTTCTLTLTNASIKNTDGYGISNGNVTDGISGGALTINVVGNCNVSTTSPYTTMSLNGGITTITGSGKLTLQSEDGTIWLGNNSVLNFTDANVVLVNGYDRAIAGTNKNNNIIVNVNHSSLEFNPSDTRYPCVSRVTEFNLVKSRFVDVDSYQADKFAFSFENGGSVTYTDSYEKIHTGKLKIEPYEIYYYNVFIDGKEISSENLDDVLGDGAFSFDADTRTLYAKKDVNDIHLSNYDSYTLHVDSDIKFTGNSQIDMYGDLTITGNGKLQMDTYSSSLISIASRNHVLTIDGTEVRCAYNITGCKKSNSKLVIKNAEVRAAKIIGFAGGITIEGDCRLMNLCKVDANGDVVDIGGNQAEGVAISKPVLELNQTNFPDAAFRNELRIQITGGSNWLTQYNLDGPTGLTLSNKGIANLKGLEYFTNLTYLDCANNQLTQLDLSPFVNLTLLSCYNNPIPASAMDDLVLSLPKQSDASLHVYDERFEGQGCEMSKMQALAAQGKGWTPRYYSAADERWLDYEGSASSGSSGGHGYDVNNDGSVDISDVVALVNFILNQ